MKRYFNIFKLSFITYILVILASKFITAQVWADICLFLFVFALVYQVIFLLFLRRKENIKLSKAIYTFFLLAISSVSCCIILDYIKMFFRGFQAIGLFGNAYGKKYYEIEAIINNDFANIIYIPILILNIILIIIYLRLNKLKQKKSNTNEH